MAQWDDVHCQIDFLEIRLLGVRYSLASLSLLQTTERSRANATNINYATFRIQSSHTRTHTACDTQHASDSGH